MKTKSVLLSLYCLLAICAALVAAPPQPTFGEPFRGPSLLSIDIENYVMIGPSAGTLEWYDADEAPGPYGLAGDEVHLKLVVANTGYLPLERIDLITEYDLSRCIYLVPLMPGASFECIIGPLDAPPGQQTNTATAQGTSGLWTVEDSDVVNYFGAIPTLDMEKHVSVDGQETWHDADEPPGPFTSPGREIYYKYGGQNMGNVPLYGLKIIDEGVSYGDIGVVCHWVDPLMPGDSFECITGPFVAASGQQGSTATAYADFRRWTAQDSDASNYFGVDHLRLR